MSMTGEREGMTITNIARRAVLVMALAALGACATQPKHSIDPADRSPPGGREAVVMVPQGEIRAAVVASNAGAGLGLVGALIDTGVNQHRTNKAEAAITPLRTELSDYNFDQQALTTTQATLTKLDWLSVKKTTFSKDTSKQNINALLDKSASPEVLMAVYDYALTADFSAMELTARFTISPKAIAAGESPDSRLKPEHAVYSQTFVYVIALSGADDNLASNCSKWSQGHARPARTALDLGIERIDALLVRQLQETPDEIKKQSQGASVEAGGHKGKLVEQSAEGTLLVDPTGRWVYVAGATAG
jgi:hypothetical protein